MNGGLLMQILKEDVREKILISSIYFISKEGFEKASMRNIAKRAGVTVGNVYRYFKNKDALMEALVKPVWNEVENLIINSYSEKENEISLDQIMAKFKDIYFRHRENLFILLNKSKGSKFENARNLLIIQIKERLKSEKNIAKIIGEDKEVFELLAKNIVDSICRIMEICGDDDKKFIDLSKKILSILTVELLNKEVRN